MKTILALSLFCTMGTTVNISGHSGALIDSDIPRGLDNLVSEDTVNSTLSSIYEMAKESSDNPSAVAPIFAGIKNLLDAIPGQRVSRGMIAHLKKMEKTKFGARMACPGHGRGDIYFLDSYPQDGEKYVYHLSTPWLMFYPDKLKERLRGQGFRVIDRPKGSKCDVWDPLFSVTYLGVKRGSLELNWWPETNEAPIQPTRPWVVQDWQTIDTVLQITYPIGEIFTTVLCSIVGGTLLIWLLYFVWRRLATRYGLGSQRQQDYWAWRRMWIQRGGQPAGAGQAATHPV